MTKETLNTKLLAIVSIIEETQQRILFEMGVDVRLIVTSKQNIEEERLKTEIIKMCDCWGVGYDKILSKRRTQDIVTMRQIISIYAKYKNKNLTLKTIAILAGITHHTSALYNLKTGYNLLSVQDYFFMNFYNKVKHFFI
ncbi:MAG: hypothetical protein JSR11_07775 [Bacteroidetes bacterium]|nr:hypothetical protein [Bacteroidota bacterium]